MRSESAGSSVSAWAAREARVRPPVLERDVAVVHLEADLDQLRAERIVPEDGHQERDAEHQVRGDALDRARVEAGVLA